jgi:hypothetical protein
LPRFPPQLDFDGYEDKASKIAHYAMDNDLTLKAAGLKFGFVTEDKLTAVKLAAAISTCELDMKAACLAGCDGYEQRRKGRIR